jgi:hypothetical protein
MALGPQKGVSIKYIKRIRKGVAKKYSLEKKLKEILYQHCSKKNGVLQLLV